MRNIVQDNVYVLGLYRLCFDQDSSEADNLIRVRYLYVTSFFISSIISTFYIFETNNTTYNLGKFQMQF